MIPLTPNHPLPRVYRPPLRQQAPSPYQAPAQHQALPRQQPPQMHLAPAIPESPGQVVYWIEQGQGETWVLMEGHHVGDAGALPVFPVPTTVVTGAATSAAPAGIGPPGVPSNQVTQE